MTKIMYPSADDVLQQGKDIFLRVAKLKRRHVKMLDFVFTLSHQNFNKFTEACEFSQTWTYVPLLEARNETSSVGGYSLHFGLLVQD